MIRLAIFASGNGSNFQTIVENQKSYAVILLVCDRINSFVIERAKKFNIPYIVYNPKDYDNKDNYELAILKELVRYDIQFIALAGYMRLVGHVLLSEYIGKIINIHPSLLPAFMGKDAIRQAIDYGVKVTGVTIHYVDFGVDTGKIIAQEALIISDSMNKHDIEKEIHQIEQRLYPSIINKLLEEEL